MHSKTLLLTALGVLFCSGCATEQQTPVPPEESSKETSVQQTPDPSTQGDDVHAVQPTPAAKEDTVDAGSVKAQLEKLGASKIEVNEQGEIVEVDLGFAAITDAGLVHLKGLASLQELFVTDAQHDRNDRKACERSKSKTSDAGKKTPLIPSDSLSFACFPGQEPSGSAGVDGNRTRFRNRR